MPSYDDNNAESILEYHFRPLWEGGPTAAERDEVMALMAADAEAQFLLHLDTECV